MKNILKNKILQIIFFIFLYSVVYSQPDNLNRTDTDTCTAFIHVSAQQDSLPIYLDEDLIGYTPLYEFPTNCEEHTITVLPPEWPVWNISAFKQTIHLKSQQHCYLDATFPQKKLVNSIPYGADIFINQEKAGKTPLLIDIPKEGPLNIEIQKTGFQTVLKNIATTAEPDVILVHLEKSDSPNDVAIISDKNINNSKTKHKKALYLSLGFTVLSGVTSVYFRDKGNNEYDKYMSATYPKDMDYHFDQSEYYDRLSSISYVAFELGVITSGYFFFNFRE